MTNLDANGQHPTPSTTDPEPDVPVETVTNDTGGGQPENAGDKSYEVRTLSAERPVKAAGESSANPDRRSEIFAKAAERRAAQMSGEFTGDMNDPSLVNGVENLSPLEQQAVDQRNKYLAEVAGEQPPQDAPAAQPKPLPQLEPDLAARKVLVTVDGEQHEMTVDEAVRIAQKNMAADNRLLQAKTLLDMAQKVAATTVTQPKAQAQEEAPPAAAQTDRVEVIPGFTDEELAEQVRLETYGTEQEMIEAKKRFASKIVEAVERASDPSRVFAIIEKENTRQVLTDFATKHTEIANDPDMQSVFIRHSQRAMIDDLVRAGMDPEALRQKITNPRDVALLHEQARIRKFPGIRPIGQIAEAAYQSASAWRNGQPANQQGDPGQRQPAHQQVRTERKQVLIQQPTERRQTPQATARAISEVESRKAAVAEARRARGQA